MPGKPVQKLLLKSTVIAHMLFEAEQKLKKCQQVSKTKAELRALCSEALSCVSEAKVSIENYRPGGYYTELGGDENALADDLQAIGNVVGDAVYKIKQGEISEAEKLLVDLTLRIRGFV